MLAPYHQDFEQFPEFLRDRYEKNTPAVLDDMLYFPYYDEERLGTVPQDKLERFATNFLARPVIKRRLTIRLGLYKINAIPILACAALALAEVGDVEECLSLLEPLLGDDPTEDLVAVAIRKWIDMEEDVVRLLEVALAQMPAFAGAMRALGYVIQGKLADEKQVAEGLRQIATGSDAAMHEVSQACHEEGMAYMDQKLHTRPESPHDDWLNIAAYCNTVLKRNRDMLAPILGRDGRLLERLNVMADARNRAWVDGATVAPRVLERWLSPLSWDADIPDSGRVEFCLADDVGSQFQVANYHGSCLRVVDGESSWAILGFITDVNKRILMCATKGGALIGRQVVGLSNEGLHVCPSYPPGHPTVQRIFEAGNVELAEQLGCGKATGPRNLCARGITAWAYSSDWEVGAEPMPPSDPGVDPGEYAG